MGVNKQEILDKLKSNPPNVCQETVRILLRIITNIQKHPKDQRKRTLPKTNPIVLNKVLKIPGGRECLLWIGFVEKDNAYSLDSEDDVVEMMKVKEALTALTIPDDVSSIKMEPKENHAIAADEEAIFPDLHKVTKTVLPPLIHKYTNPFLRQIEILFHRVQVFDDADCKQRARALIPVHRLEIQALKAYRLLQSEVKKGIRADAEFNYQDMMLMELLTWFKEDFFTWVDAPKCNNCHSNTKLSHVSANHDLAPYANKVEVYHCSSCGTKTDFVRYNDLNILLETRRGRCGEWAQVFTLLCHAMGWDARFVNDELDHVWTEVYSPILKRWVHCDPCENAYDTPLMYEHGWKKKLTYVIAYSPQEVQDVTWRYSSDHKSLLTRRKKCTEAELIEALIALRRERQRSMRPIRVAYLTKRILAELGEMLLERKPNESEFEGRTSGAETWRQARGETPNEINPLWQWEFHDRHIINDKLTVRYSTVLDAYQFVRGDDYVKTIEGWNDGVHKVFNIFRKEENDWQVAYLAREKNNLHGGISWRFQLMSEVKVIDTVSITMMRQVFENGCVEISISGEREDVTLNPDETSLTTALFSGDQSVVIMAKLYGGRGNVAWQHAQLFRQNLDDEGFPFSISFTFKDKTVG